MVQEIIAIELSAMRKRAEETSRNIARILWNLSVERQTLWQVVGGYSIKRVELLKEKLNTRGLTWCTYCSAVLQESEVGFLLLEGREERSGGYQNSCYGFHDFSRFHRACLKCREEVADKHGSRGDWDRLSKDQESFYAFHVEKRDDGYYARKFGSWVKLDDEKCKLPELSSQLVEQLAEEYNLPPRIELRDDKVIIHDQVATAKV